MKTVELLSDTTIAPGVKIRSFIERIENNPLQLSLFQQEEEESYDEWWYRYALQVAKTLPDKFEFHQLRFRLRYGPRHPNQYGRLSKMLAKNGYRRVAYVSSVVDSRKGGTESVWERITE